MLAALRRNDIRKVAPYASKALIVILVVVGDEQISCVFGQIIDIRFKTVQGHGRHRVDHVGVFRAIFGAQIGQGGDFGLVDGIGLFKDNRDICG